jgi:hypothetical protein
MDAAKDVTDEGEQVSPVAGSGADAFAREEGSTAQVPEVMAVAADAKRSKKKKKRKRQKQEEAGKDRRKLVD